MLENIMIVCFVFAALFSLLCLINLLRPTKKKSLKIRKKIKGQRRLFGLAGAIFWIAAIVLRVIAAQPAGLQKPDSALSPVAAYKEANQSAERLPKELFALGDDYYLRTADGAIYGYLWDEETDGGAYQKGLVIKEAEMVAGAEELQAVLAKGKLAVNGAFEYWKYEKNNEVLKNKVYAKNCSFVAGNSNNIFYVEDGDLYTLGYNGFGQLGDGTVRNRAESAMILENTASVSVSETHMLAVDIFGNLYGCGDNSYSEMGNRTTSQTTTPIKLMSGVRQAAAGKYFSVVLTKDGDVFAAGRNDKGQLGTGDCRDYATYKKILSGICKIAVSGNSCAALNAEGELFVWGENAERQLSGNAKQLDAPKRIAKDVYDVAMGKASMGILRLNRDFEVSGAAREKKNKTDFQEVWGFDAELPEEERYRESVEMPERPE